MREFCRMSQSIRVLQGERGNVFPILLLKLLAKVQFQPFPRNLDPLNLIRAPTLVGMSFQCPPIECLLDIPLAEILVRVEPQGLQMGSAKSVIIPLAARL